MMKIVINSCYGGFGLSAIAIKRAIAEGAKGILVMGKVVKRPNDIDAGGGYKINTFGVLYKGDESYYFDSKIGTDPILIKIIEEIGDRANDQYSRLKIIEIPDGVEWELREYNGCEYVEEKHRRWS